MSLWERPHITSMCRLYFRGLLHLTHSFPPQSSINWVMCRLVWDAKRILSVWTPRGDRWVYQNVHDEFLYCLAQENINCTHSYFLVTAGGSLEWSRLDSSRFMHSHHPVLCSHTLPCTFRVCKEAPKFETNRTSTCNITADKWWPPFIEHCDCWSDSLKENVPFFALFLCFR